MAQIEGGWIIPRQGCVHRSKLGKMKAAPNSFTERALVDRFVCHLQERETPWGPLNVGLEFYYKRGRTDVVACTSHGDVVAFEAKLSRWRDALHQAYRNTCFAHLSYVLLPRATARVACNYEAEFLRRRVGLCYIDDEQLVVLFHPTRGAPIQPWLSAEAVRCIFATALPSLSGLQAGAAGTMMLGKTDNPRHAA